MPDEDKDNEGPDAEQVQNEMAKMLANVKDMTMYNISVLASQAWHHLGLVSLTGAEAAPIDLVQAKMAIDLFDANLKVMSNYLDKDIIKQLKQTLMDLQLNYVNKSK
ncbi:MAG: DUF1844 domain-containing protein [Candidatus Thermoplasmatota archaeon]|nr:DUF1844 domain-containing protein [Candidatus Thermoplasmatota archaeon]